ncbi:MAG: aminoglycoside phosphotransferase family protein [Candidatus Nanopelagicales bacterium]
MSIHRADLGAPVAIGRSAEVFAWPERDMVVKLFPADYDAGQIQVEAAACQEVVRQGLTPIGCHGTVQVDDAVGLLFDRVDGESLTKQAERNPLRTVSGARDLARLHAELHEAHTDQFPEIREVATAALGTPPLEFLRPGQRERAEQLIAALPAGDCILHLDFHTENVFAHGDGLAIIDWQTALRGAAAADVAMTKLLIRDAELWPGTPFLKRVLVQLVRRLVLSTYLSEYQRLTGMTSQQIDAWRVPVVVLRMSTLDIASEREKFRRELTDALGEQE